MPNPLMYPANLQWLGVAFETTYGTAAAAPTYWVPLISPKWAPQTTPLKNQALYGDMAMTHGQVLAVRYDTIDYSTSVFIDLVMQHMKSILGGADVVTGAGDPWTHKTSLLNTGNGQPTSCTLWLSTGGAECWRMTGAQLVSLDVETKVADSLANLTASWMGLPATVVTAPSNTPSTKAPMPSWNTTLTIGGQATTNYSDVKLTIKRENEAIFGAAGSQSPYAIFVGGCTITGAMTAVYQGYSATTSDMANFLANTQPILLLQVNPAGDATHFAKWQHTQVAYDPTSVQDNGKYMEVTSTFEAIANTTDANAGGQSPEQFILLTNVSAAY